MEHSQEKIFRILLVDDDKGDFLITQNLLTKSNFLQFEIDWQPDFEEALEALGERHHDVCLLDFYLGSRNGLDFLEAVKAKGFGTPIIMLTGQGDHGIDMRALESGAADFLEKGRLTPENLERSIRYAIQHQKTLMALEKSERELRVAHDILEERIEERTKKLKEEISEREKAEKKERESKRILELFFKHSLTSFVLLDRDFNFIRVNEAYAKADDKKMSEFPGLNHFELYPSDAIEIFEEVRDTKVPFQTFAHPFSFPEHPEWGTTYWDWALVPILDAAGDVEFFIFTLQDVTKQKEAQIQLVQASKLTSIGEMATGVAHELNQPLNIIRMAAEMSLETLNDGVMNVDSFKNNQKKILNHVDRAATIIDHMRMFGRKPSERATMTQLEEAVRNVVGFLRKQFGLQEIEIDLDIPETVRPVNGDIILLEQVIMNLLTNARDAIEENGVNGSSGKRISIRIEDDPSLEKVRLIVRDTGGGINGKVMDRIFDPFFTTKEIGKGTGIGLSICCGIIKEMGGMIAAENEDDGARFTLSLPALAEEMDRHKAG